MVRGRNERGSGRCLWFVFPGEMPSKWECLFLNEGIMTSREGFVLGASEQVLGQVGPGLGALLPGSCRGVLQPQPSCWKFGSTLDNLGRGYCRIFFFSPCFLSFSSPFSAREGFMSHVKNILIPGHY